MKVRGFALEQSWKCSD